MRIDTTHKGRLVAKVHVNGHDVGHCVAADNVQGWADAIAYYRNGEMMFSKDSPGTVRIFGHVDFYSRSGRLIQQDGTMSRPVSSGPERNDVNRQPCNCSVWKRHEQQYPRAVDAIIACNKVECPFCGRERAAEVPVDL